MSVFNWILLYNLLSDWLRRCSCLQVLVGNVRKIKIHLSIVLLSWLSSFRVKNISSAELVWILSMNYIRAIYYLNNIKFIVADSVFSASYLNLFTPGTFFRFLVPLLKIPKDVCLSNILPSIRTLTIYLSSQRYIGEQRLIYNIGSIVPTSLNINFGNVTSKKCRFCLAVILSSCCFTSGLGWPILQRNRSASIVLFQIVPR